MTAISHEWQLEVGDWAQSFNDYDTVVWGTIEEIGELFRCLTKMHQGIRGTREEWEKELGKEIADVIIRLAQVAWHHNLNIGECVDSKWEEVKNKDWVRDPLGKGI